MWWLAILHNVQQNDSEKTKPRWIATLQTKDIFFQGKTLAKLAELP